MADVHVINIVVFAIFAYYISQMTMLTIPIELLYTVIQIYIVFNDWIVYKYRTQMERSYSQPD